jgi:hypothetical protein
MMRNDLVLTNSTRLDLPQVASAFGVTQGLLFGLEDGMFARMLLEANPLLHLIISDCYSSQYRKTKKLGALLSLRDMEDRFVLIGRDWLSTAKSQLEVTGKKFDLACFDLGNPFRVRGWTALMEPLSLVMGYSFYDRQKVKENDDRHYLRSVERWADRHKTRLYLTGEHWPAWWATLRVAG